MFYTEKIAIEDTSKKITKASKHTTTKKKKSMKHKGSKRGKEGQTTLRHIENN